MSENMRIRSNRVYIVYFETEDRDYAVKILRKATEATGVDFELGIYEKKVEGHEV